MTIHDFMLFISVSGSFWLAEFLVLVALRLYQVRGQFTNWFGIGADRRRVNALLLGLTSFMIFATLQRGKATWSWFFHTWREPDTFTAFYHTFLIGILGMLWWAFGAISNNKGGRYWLWSVGIGTFLGVIATWLG